MTTDITRTITESAYLYPEEIVEVMEKYYTSHGAATCCMSNGLIFISKRSHNSQMKVSVYYEKRCMDNFFVAVNMSYKKPLLDILTTLHDLTALQLELDAANNVVIHTIYEIICDKDNRQQIHENII